MSEFLRKLINEVYIESITNRILSYFVDQPSHCRCEVVFRYSPKVLQYISFVYISSSAVDKRAGLSIPRWPCHPGVEVRSPGPALLVWHLDMRYSLRPFAPPPVPLIHVGQLSVTGTSKGTRYWLFPGKEWLG